VTDVQDRDDNAEDTTGGNLGVPEPSPAQQRRSLAVLALFLSVVVAAAVVTNRGTTLVAIAVIAAVIMLHELGHFTAAKLSGMKVTEYFLGFGPRLWSLRKGETEYGVKAIPAGGYVRIVGMNNLEQVESGDETRTYRQASFPRRLAVAVAGSTVHFILALLALWVLLAFVGQSRLVSSVDKLTSVSGGSPAQAAGFQLGDKILSYDGHPAYEHWTALHDYIGTHLGAPVTFVVSRGGKTVQLVATPGDRSLLRDSTGQSFGPDHVGFLGIAPGAAKTYYGPIRAVPHAVGSFWSNGVIASFKGIGHLFSPHGLSGIGKQVVSAPGKATSSDAGNRPVSVVGIVEIANQVRDWEFWLGLFISANIFVGIINLFPLLPFDGGHVAIAVYERIRSRPGRRYTADVAKMLPYSFALVVLLGFVMLSSLYLDVAHPISFH